MAARETELLQEVADAVGALMEFWGFKRVMGRIWSLLYLRNEPLSAAELCEELAISTGAASMALSELEHWGVVKRSRKPGDRRVLRERELLQIDRALEVFDRVRSQLETMGGTRLGAIADRIEKLSDLARIGRGLVVALVQQGRVDLAPLMRFARKNR